MFTWAERTVRRPAERGSVGGGRVRTIYAPRAAGAAAGAAGGAAGGAAAGFRGQREGEGVEEAVDVPSFPC